MQRLTPEQLTEELINVDDLLIVQDLDGVCMQLVNDPLTRSIDASYVKAASKLQDSFVVLTNGEHEGRRGVNRLVERALGNPEIPGDKGLYLAGLAAGGVQLQDRFGNISHPGVSQSEIEFLAAAPKRMKQLLLLKLPEILPSFPNQIIENLIKNSILDTQLSPTINLNNIFALFPDSIDQQRALQSMLEELMQNLEQEAINIGFEGSFFLHVAPNLGRDKKGRELLKLAQSGDIGTTDIQFMLSGSLKEAGLLVLINNHIANKYGLAPLGDDFNVRTAPRNYSALLELARNKIPPDKLPLIIGIGDTVTSNKSPNNKTWLRGGSDRYFLTLLQDLGRWSGNNNRVILVDSSHGEVDRPSLEDERLEGISDPEDPLQFNVLMPDGPQQYVTWFKDFAHRRSEYSNPILL